MIAQRRLTQGAQSQSRALEHLATGLRISRAKDDPAGLIFSELARADIARTHAALRVLTRIDTVITTAESGLGEVSDLLTQAESLVVGVANAGGISAEEFDAAQLEFDSILATLDRISDATRFNGTKLLDGSATFSFGDDSITIRNVSSRALSLRGLNLRDAGTAQTAVQAAADAVATHRASLGAFQSNTIGSALRSREVLSENLTEMRSLVLDANIAAETAELTRTQILASASTRSLLIAGRQIEAALALLPGR